MADYKLRLDVDAKLLEKNLEAAVKKAFGKIPNMSGSSGGGSGGNSKANNIFDKVNKETENLNKGRKKLTEKELRDRYKYQHDLDRIKQREKAALRASNIMLEKSGVQMARTFTSIGALLGGRMGAGAGSALDIAITKLSSASRTRKNRKLSQNKYDQMDAQGKRENERDEDGTGAYDRLADIGDKIKGSKFGKAMQAKKDKFEGKHPNASKLGGAGVKAGKGGMQMVKLAGIGAALAGGAGLGKMLIDSSPMLKAMLKLLNVGVMLILRPIGDFIGFMLRPLLLHFVKKVAIPAYKNGSKLAKEWGDKAGKAMLMLFTDFPKFMELAIVNPIKGSLEKGWNGMMTELAKLGVLLSFWKSDSDKQKELKALDAELVGKNAATDNLYPGHGDMDQLQRMMDEGNEEMQGPLQDTINNPIWPQIVMNEAFAETEDNTGETAVESAKTNEKLDEVNAQLKAAAAAAVEIAQTDANNAEQTKRFEEARDAVYEEASTPMGSKEIETAAKAAAETFCWGKSYAEAQASGFSDGSEVLLSPAARKILARFDNYKQGIGEGTSAQAGGREGTKVGAIATEDMGGMYGTGEYDEITKKEIMAYENMAVDTRAGMEAYSEAVEESARTGEEVRDIFDRLRGSVIDGYNITTQTTETHKQIYSMMLEGKGYMSEVALAMKDMMMDINAAAQWVNSKLRVVSSYRNSRGSPTPAARTAQQIGNVNPTNGMTGNSRPLYKITFGDGTSKTQALDPNSLKYMQNQYASGGTVGGKSILSLRKMAIGGVINEPIFGVGQNTGQGYLMGESGPETITPGVGASTQGGTTTFNITINAQGIGDIERQLKPAILKMLKESTSRAGIV